MHTADCSDLCRRSEKWYQPQVVLVLSQAVALAIVPVYTITSTLFAVLMLYIILMHCLGVKVSIKGRGEFCMHLLIEGGHCHAGNEFCDHA
jgi:hypothetical protein